MYFSSTSLNTDLPGFSNARMETIAETVKETPNVGLINLPIELSRKALTRKDFKFTLMVIGRSGLGKSTLVNSMFLTNNNDSIIPTRKTNAVQVNNVTLNENGINLMLTVVDTPGFGDAVDNSDCWTPIVEYIENQYDEYLSNDMGCSISSNDQRVHCCLYFIQPTGHKLKALDIECMKKICDKVNLIPVIAKADTLTSEECILFKKQILNDINENDIKLYEFPDLLEESEYNANSLFKNRIPFAIIGANSFLETGGKKLRIRKYPWGIVEIENLNHCDFIALKTLIVYKHFQDLIDTTHNGCYRRYKYQKLANYRLYESNMNCIAQDQEKEIKIKKLEDQLKILNQLKIHDEFNQDTAMAFSKKQKTEEKQPQFEHVREVHEQLI